MLRSVTALAALLVVICPTAGLARCGDDPGDAAAIAATRAAVETGCPCASAEHHSAYVRCAAKAARSAILSGDLRAECRGVVRKCAARSTCGRPGAITCCRIDYSGASSCKVRAKPAVSFRITEPYSTEGSISLPSCHSFHEVIST